MSRHQTADSPPSKPTTARVGFLDLSAELRNKIYVHLLHSEKTIHLWWTCDKDRCNHRVKRNYHYKKRARVYPQILQVCKQVHAEATPILYGSNRFSLCEPQDVIAFVDQINGSVQFLRFVEVEWPGLKKAAVRNRLAAMLKML